MTDTVFYILTIVYCIKYYMVSSFNPVGNEFALLVILGILNILTKLDEAKL